jgi:hypothetical protein
VVSDELSLDSEPCLSSGLLQLTDDLMELDGVGP